MTIEEIWRLTSLDGCYFLWLEEHTLDNEDAPGSVTQRLSPIRGNVPATPFKIWEKSPARLVVRRYPATTCAATRASISALLSPASVSNSWVCWPSSGGACR